MSEWRGIGVIVALGVAMGISGPAEALDGTAQTCDNLVHEGLADSQANRYGDAVRALERAYALRPTPLLLGMLANAYVRLGQCDKAVERAQSFRRTASAVDVETAQESLTTALRFCPEATIASEPVGANLSIDGRPVGRTPWSGRLSVGDHIVSTHAGALGQDTVLRVDERSAPVSLSIVLTAKPRPAVGPALPLATPAQAIPVELAPPVAELEPTSLRPVPPSTPRTRWAPIILFSAAGASAVAGVAVGFENHVLSFSPRSQGVTQSAHPYVLTFDVTMAAAGAFALTGVGFMLFEPKQ